MNNNENNVTAIPLFTSPVFTIDKPEYLEVTRKISKKFISQRKEEVDLNPNYPVYMTEAINQDPEMLEFSNLVAQIAWELLKSQGYLMQAFNTYFTEMWCQEHHNMSSMDRHIHGNGAVISGFYFLDCPENSCRILFHDPREAKVITNLPEFDMNDSTHASNIINFTPKEGQIIFTNSWLPHSFTKNEAKEPMRFIHFNIAVELAHQEAPTTEVI